MLDRYSFALLINGCNGLNGTMSVLSPSFHLDRLLKMLQAAITGVRHLSLAKFVEPRRRNLMLLGKGLNTHFPFFEDFVKRFSNIM